MGLVAKVFRHFETKKNQVIPLKDDARKHLLGCQLEHSFLGDDCGKVGDSVGEAQHGQASAQIGALTIFRWRSANAQTDQHLHEGR